ncbi:MAG: phage tail protein [Frankiales bacterium]|nr:phage tail protein [Frankiales bacterium]
MTMPQQRSAPPPPPRPTLPAPKPFGRYTTVPRPPAGDTAPRMMTGFWLVVDGVSLPTFSECQGLAAEYEVVPWVEGGQNEFVHQLPGRISFTPVTLTRYVDGASGGLAAWFSSVADIRQTYRTARISAVDPAGKPIAHWDLTDVFPSKYTGPTFSAGGTAAATETLELVHHGFVFAYDPPPRS